MKFKLVEKLILYNANNSNRSVGDCVLRSLSLITGISYTDIRNIGIAVAKVESIKENEKLDYTSCWNEIINALDLSWNLSARGKKISEEEQLYKYIAKITNNKSYTFSSEYIEEPISVRKFAYDNDQGRYILITKDHAVTIINGDIYDSWDSSKEIVENAFKLESISNVDSGLISADADDLLTFNKKLNIASYKQLIEDTTKIRLNNFISKRSNKIIGASSNIQVVDNTTIKISILYKDINNREISKTSFIKLNYNLTGDKEIKEECLRQLNKKLSEQFYEIRKQLENN